MATQQYCLSERARTTVLPARTRRLPASLSSFDIRDIGNSHVRLGHGGETSTFGQEKRAPAHDRYIAEPFPTANIGRINRPSAVLLAL